MVSVHKRYRTFIFTPYSPPDVVWDRHARFPRGFFAAAALSGWCLVVSAAAAKNRVKIA